MRPGGPADANDTRLDRSMRFQINERKLAMFTTSRLVKSSLLILLTATLTTTAYARGGGHGGSNGSMSGASAHAVAGSGNQTASNGSTAHGFGVHPLWNRVVHIPTAPQGAAK
ncbi:MAG: hypothetical protein ACTHLO_04555 [Pseudolabrys sp.]